MGVAGSNDIRSPKEIETVLASLMPKAFQREASSNDIRSPKEIETRKVTVVFMNANVPMTLDLQRRLKH